MAKKSKAMTIEEVTKQNKAGARSASLPSALPALQMPKLKTPAKTSGTQMPVLGKTTSKGVGIVQSVANGSGTQSSGRTTAPKVKTVTPTQQSATDRAANIRAFGAGDYSGGGELLEKAYKTARAAVKGIGSSYANIGGKFEGNGPLSEHFDQLCPDSFFGKDTWEQAESAMQQRVLERALEKGGLMPKDLDYVLAGDLLNQNIGATFALRDFNIPFYGVYGACSTMGETLSLAAMAVASGAVRMAAAQTSSHFCTAERQYRMPLPYGSQRSPTAQWTATAAGCCILGAQAEGPYITHVTRGRIVDLGVTDMTNMGAAMAPVNVKLRPYPTKWLAWFYLYTQNTNKYGGNTSNYIYNHTIIFIFRCISKSE